MHVVTYTAMQSPEYVKASGEVQNINFLIAKLLRGVGSNSDKSFIGYSAEQQQISHSVRTVLHITLYLTESVLAEIKWRIAWCRHLQIQGEPFIWE